MLMINNKKLYNKKWNQLDTYIQTLVAIYVYIVVIAIVNVNLYKVIVSLKRV